jgi:RNA polymerase sigma-70 factor (ECF subfamily)
MTRDQAAARACIEDLYAAHHAEIYSYLVRLLHDDDLAADLAQETFVKAYRAFDTLEDLGRARPWLYRIAGRTALDELRRQRIVHFIPWTGDPRGMAASAEEVVLRGRLTDELERALMAIPERQRMAIVLAEVQGLNGPELAEAMGTSHDAARALLARARESLRQGLAVERARASMTDSGERDEAAAGPGGRGRGRPWHQGPGS